ncbi:protein kinase [Listeria innocua]|uniref:protein kinase domain-containing protein n=1 Tax=Listeria innocua TaxID=1642 RepID=UPI0016243411|nr:protein kinase [Listeria innocua]MBC1366284.1 protein kinase [Listeria innocua]
MISSRILKEIAEEFIGDSEGSSYSYKRGSDLVEFFNEYFDEDDSYGQGFPSRKYYVSDKLERLERENTLEEFFSIILSSKFLRVYEKCNRNTIEEEILIRINRFNEIFDKVDLKIEHKNDKIFLTPIQENLIEIGSGGFATVYRFENHPVAIKKLKDEFKTDYSITHRFNREYEITESLQDIDGIISISDYNPKEYSYKMKYCETNLYDFIHQNELNIEYKLEIVLRILSTISQVHKKEIIHRDLSPNNILIDDSKIYIADFGIGKNFNDKYSHQTKYTRSLGQYRYAAPEQLNNLSDANFCSDVFSLGKIINFIFTKDPENVNHSLAQFTNKSIATDPSYRYEDAEKLHNEIKSFLIQKDKEDYTEKIMSKIRQDIYDDEVAGFLLSLNDSELSDILAEENHAKSVLRKLLISGPKKSLSILTKLAIGVRGDFYWNSYDNFSEIAYIILKSDDALFDYDSLIAAAEILNYTANYVNRFDAQNKVKNLIDNGIDPTIEDILNSNSNK